MNQLIIFDFNRTLYDPDANQLIDGAQSLLDTARDQGYTLILLAMAAPSRQALIEQLGIAEYFAEIILMDAKSQKVFRQLAQKYDTDLSKSFVIGDRALGEITYGHKAGWPTVWYRQGRFADEEPVGFTPEHTVTTLSQFQKLITE